MASKAEIISGPDPMELCMWGLLSHYAFVVKVKDKMVTLHIHCQQMIAVPKTEFQIVSFKGYDEITGRRVRCDVYHSTSPQKKFGTVFISKTKAHPTELAKKYGPGGWKYRKKPLQISRT